MASDEKISQRNAWFQFLITQLLALLVYSLGLAYWLGGFSSRVEQHDKLFVQYEQKVIDIDKNGTQPGRLNEQMDVMQEKRITQMEDVITIMRPKLDVMANQIDSMDKKLDKMAK